MPPSAPEALPTRSGGSVSADLRESGLALARAAWWATAALSLAFFISNLPGRYPPHELYSTVLGDASVPSEVVREGLSRLGLSPAVFAGMAYALVIARGLACYLLGALIYWRRRGDPIALLVAILLVAMPGGDSAPPDLHALADNHPLQAAAGRLVETVALTLLLWLFLLFPDGHFRPRWTRLVAVGWLLGVTGTLFLPGSSLDAFTWPPLLYAGFFLGGLGTAVYAQVWRYRQVSGPVERQQAKWVGLGLTTALGNLAVQIALAVFVPAGWPEANPAQAVLADLVFNLIEGIAILTIPVTLAVAMLRYQLWDIDLIIRRTLVYGTLSVTLAALYLGGVTVLQQLLRPLLGQNNQLAIAASTLAIAALFRPLRQRIQGLIDQRFYRRKYDAARTLAAFSASLRDETDLEGISADVLGVVQETMQPAHASIWVRPPTKRALGHEDYL